MLNNNLNDAAALQMLLSFVPVSDLIKAAMNGFSNDDSINAKENADLCYKILKAYYEG